jgi:hypothetical protein
MPCNSCPLENALVQTKSRKSYKKESKCCPPSPCDVECCLPETTLDCCSLPYQRLDKLRTIWSQTAATGNINLPVTAAAGSVTNVYTRAGNAVTTPVAATFGDDGVALVTGTTSLDIVFNLAYYAYLFVNTHRYVSFEACGKLDQVVGWYVDTATGQLELFQALPDLNLQLTDTRLTYDSLTVAELTSVQKAKLYNLNTLYKASIKAIERVSANPKEEGNIVEVVDKCGQKWLLAINRASSPNGTTSVADFATQFVIVGVPLC